MADTWLEVPLGSPFPAESLPYGVFSSAPGGGPRVGVAVGAHVLDLAALLDDEVFGRPSLNSFLARGPDAWRATRGRLHDLLSDRSRRDEVARHLVPLSDVRLHL